jgi:hypothetical protein
VLEPSWVRQSSTSPSVLNLMKPDGSVDETRLSGLMVVASWPQLLSWFLPSPLGPYPALLPPPLDPSPHRASLGHWPKTRSSVLSSLDCSLVDQQRIRRLALLTSADQELLLPSGKPDDPVWHSRLSDFFTLRPSCPIGGRHIRNGRLLRSSLRGQNPQQVLTIPGGSASVVASMVCTTPPKEDKVHTSSLETPTTHAMVARP